jgi:hypothetical protein
MIQQTHDAGQFIIIFKGYDDLSFSFIIGYEFDTGIKQPGKSGF